MTVCEDLWQDGGPHHRRGPGDGRAVVNINGSPYERGKDDVRLRLASAPGRRGERDAGLRQHGRRPGRARLRRRLVGRHRRRATAGPRAAVRSRPVVVDLGAAGGHRRSRRQRRRPRRHVDAHRADRPAHATGAALRARCRGGVAASAWRPKQRSTARSSLRPATTSARTASHPSCSGSPAASTPPSSRRSRSTRSAPARCTPSRCRAAGRASIQLADAAELARRQGITHMRGADRRHRRRLREASVELHGLAAENLQARVRGTILMGLSNEHGHLVLTTGNKSELATGYSTLYGDSAGGFAPIKDVPKTLVWELARWRNAQAVDAATNRRSRRTRSTSRRRPSCGPTSSTPTRCPTTRCSTGCSTATSSTTSAATRCSPSATTRPWSTGSSGWSTAPNTSAASTRPGPRSARATSVATAGCRSPIAGANRPPNRSQRVSRMEAARVRRTATRGPKGWVHPMSTSPTSPVSSFAPPIAAWRPAAPGARTAAERWAMLTSYDQLTAGIFEAAGIDVLLVGDSAGEQRARLSRHRLASPSTSCCRWCAPSCAARRPLSSSPTCRSGPTRCHRSKRLRPRSGS